VTEPGDPSPHHVVQKPRKRTDQVTIADFTLLVRVPGRPSAVRVFTDDEADDAAAYAAATGGSIAELPLAPPAGYIVADDGSLRPAPAPAGIGKADSAESADAATG